MTDSDAVGRSVTSKVISILSAFEGDKARLSLTDIAHHAEIPVPTAHRILAELVELDALRRDDHGRYRVSRRMWKIAQNAGRELSQTARPHLADLFQRTGRTCHLAIRDGDKVMIIDRLYASDQAGRAAKIADRGALHESAVGKVLLASQDDWIRAAYFARDPSAHPMSAADFAAELATIQGQGFATHLSTDGAVASVSVPVLVAGHALAALGLVATTTNPHDLLRHVPALQSVATEMEPEVRRWPHARAMVAEINRDH